MPFGQPPAIRSHAESAVGDSIARVLADWGRARPDLDVSPIAVTARVARLGRQFGPRLETVFRRFGTRGAEFEVLATLVRLEGEDISQTRLVAELDLSAATVSLRIDRLARQGLVRRDPDPADGRGALVVLADRGRHLFEATAPEHLANARELLSGLSEHERADLGRLLGKLLSTLEDPGPDDRLVVELGVVLEAAPVALERRRAVGLSPRSGLLVRHVDPGGAAAAAEIRRGDLLTSADGQPMRTHHDLHIALARTRAHEIRVEIVRGETELQLRVRPAHRG